MRDFTEHEKLYYDANIQKDYLPLILDPSTPEKIIRDIADRISILDLKLQIIKHPNIPIRSVRYILDKADKKPYQKDIISAIFNNVEKMNISEYQHFKDYYNKAGRLQSILLESIKTGQIDVNRYSSILTWLNLQGDQADMKIAAAMLTDDNCNSETFEIMFNYLGLDFMTFTLLVKSVILKLTSNKNFPHDAAAEFFKKTGFDWFLSEETKSIFLF